MTTKDQKLSPISLFALRLRMLRNKKEIGTGTGFLYEHPGIDNKYFLVTNYHVLTARAPDNPAMLLPDYPDSPDEIAWSCFDRPELTIGEGSVSLFGLQWLEHPKRSEGVDFVALPIELPNDIVKMTNRTLPLVDDISVSVGTDLFIVGFPYGYSPIQPFPIYKRGTVASEPVIHPGGLPYFLIDANTAPGMSGSPVFAIEKRLKIYATKTQAKLMEDIKSGATSALSALQDLTALTAQEPHWETEYKLIGIYSSRITGPVGSGKSGDYGLGKVWTIDAVAQAFEEANIVDHPYPPHPVT